MKVLPPLVALRAFDFAARHLSFGKAGDELSVTQSAISRHIRNLEEYLQRPLFVRQGRSVTLTEDGKRYHKQISEGLGLIQEATACMMSQRRACVLKINVPPSFGMRWLAPRLHRFSQLHSEIELQLVSPAESGASPMNGAHVAVRVAPKGHTMEIDGWGTTDCEYLLPCSLIAVYSPAHIEPPVALQDVALHTLISTATRGAAWHDWFRLGGMEDVRIRRALSFRRHFMSIQAAIDGKGIAIVPEVLVEQELLTGALRALMHKMETAGGYCLLMPQRRIQDKTVEHFRRWIAQAAGEHRASLKAALFSGKVVPHGKLRAVNDGRNGLALYRA